MELKEELLMQWWKSLMKRVLNLHGRFGKAIRISKRTLYTVVKDKSHFFLRWSTVSLVRLRRARKLPRTQPRRMEN